jgi:hypothetical protein
VSRCACSGDRYVDRRRVTQVPAQVTPPWKEIPW